LEEQLADETYEQFEERVLNKRAAAMYHLVRAKLQLSDAIPFSEMTIRNTKKQVSNISFCYCQISSCAEDVVKLNCPSINLITYSILGRAKVLHTLGFKEKSSH
jgi:hypothetical protein